MKEQEKDKKEDCPLCQVSDETLDRLKGEDEEKSSQEEKPIKKKRKFLGKALSLILILALVGLIFYSFFAEYLSGRRAAGNSDSVQVGSLAPAFSLKDTNGNEITLSAFQDKKPVLLIFWATWCSFCAKELPGLKTFTETHKNEIEVIVISSGESKETIKDYIREKDINFLMLLDKNRAVWNSYLVRGTPSHFLIDSKGKIVAIRSGLALEVDLKMMLTMLTELQ